MCDQVHTLFQLDPTILYTHNPMAMGGFALRVQRNTSTVSQPSPKFDDGRSDSLEADTLDMSRPGPLCGYCDALWLYTTTGLSATITRPVRSDVVLRKDVQAAI